MGPVALFDKSFLQSLSADESVWFDRFFLPVICPIFYVETLADLGKPNKKGRRAEDEVSIIAGKFPEMSGSPSSHHFDLCLANLLGQAVPMDGRIPMSGGHPVRSGNRTGYVYKSSPESEAFSRWLRGEFQEVERMFAQRWRIGLEALGLQELAKSFRALGIDGKSFKSLEEAHQVAKSIVNSRQKHFEKMKLAISILRIPRTYHAPIIEEWKIRGYPALTDFAPFAAYVLEVELFFYFSLAASLISTQRPSNRTDIAYLFYLPFGTIFVSNDKLHQKSAPLFSREDQEFVWGPDLKVDLKNINEHYKQLPREIRDQGVMSFAGSPPREGNFLVAKLWDRQLGKGWRKSGDISVDKKNGGFSEKLLNELKAFSNAAPISADQVEIGPEESDNLSIERKVRKKKGSWFQVPKDLPQEEDSED